MPRMLACRNCSCQQASSNFMDKVIKHVVAQGSVQGQMLLRSEVALNVDRAEATL